MEFTRRNILRLGALSLASATSPSWAHDLSIDLPAGTGPAADSILVLIEGPWLLTQKSVGTMECISLPDPHVCQMGLWNAASNSLVNPYDPSQPGPMLANGTAVTGTLTSGNKRPDVVATFDAAFNREDVSGPDNFVYIRNQGLKVVAQATDRAVTVPVPDNVYVAGRLLNGAVVDASIPQIIVNPLTAKIFVTYVLEYTQDSKGSTSLKVDDGSGKTFTLTKGQHLIFQMQNGEPTTADVPHITHAFSSLVSRVGAGTIPLTVAFPAAVLTADVQLGVNAQGLSATELGLHVNTIAGHKLGTHAAPAKKQGKTPMHHLKEDKNPSCSGGGLPIFP